MSKKVDMVQNGTEFILCIMHVLRDNFTIFVASVTILSPLFFRDISFVIIELAFLSFCRQFISVSKVVHIESIYTYVYIYKLTQTNNFSLSQKLATMATKISNPYSLNRLQHFETGDKNDFLWRQK